jgi:hypothetical protein
MKVLASLGKKKVFFGKENQKTFILLDAFDESAACRRLQAGDGHGMKVKPA